MPGNFIYLAPRVLSRSRHAFSSGSDFLKAPVSMFNWQRPPNNISIYWSGHSNMEQKKEELLIKRDWKSEDGDWASTLNILVILGNSTFPNLNFFICTMKGLRRISCILPAPKPMVLFIDSSIGWPDPSTAALSTMIASRHMWMLCICSWSKLKYALWAKFWRHKMKKKKSNIFQ